MDDLEQLRKDRRTLVREYGEVDPNDLDADRDARTAARLVRALDRRIERLEARAERAAELDAETDPRKLAAELPRY